MIQLQRASAGSGKTYTLAKKFIWYLITAQRKEGAPRLRSAREIADTLPRILAITFTNKATNEMKQRIVDKLARLAEAHDGLTSDEAQKTDYLVDFSTDLSETFSKIAEACRTALECILNDYSDFKVSTIDSFFQNVLRTFAYEANLNDSYQIEIDDKFLAMAAVDATMHALDAKDPDPTAVFWLKQLAARRHDKEDRKWNIFLSDGNSTIASGLVNSLNKIENEDFKEIRKKLDNFFNNEDGQARLMDAYIKLMEDYIMPYHNELAEAKKYGRQLEAAFKKYGLNPHDHGARHLAGRLEKLPQLPSSKSGVKFTCKVPKEVKDVLNPKADQTHGEELLEIAEKLFSHYLNWLEMPDSPVFRTAKAYLELIPQLGLLGATRKMMAQYLEANNTIKLAETNTLLRRIIGDDDAPFVYERLGGAINHYLIDEFQDTSRMQWENIVPLLTESNGRGNSNLIIGDAKQSIYRFRNADPSLITSAVAKTFPDTHLCGNTKKENTNWRSKRNIVEFNNFLFGALIEKLTASSTGLIDFADLYSNVMQYPSHREKEGYVEINFLAKLDKQDQSEEEADDNSDYPATRYLPGLVLSLLERGYRQKDIAFLTHKNKEGKAIIKALVEYNNSLKPGQRRIEFVSEESLTISSAEAVGIIVSVLRQMTLGNDNNGEKADRPRANWADIKCNFAFYALSHPDMEPAQLVKKFLEEKSPAAEINIMLADMQTTALPALVEAIVETFVPLNLRESQAVFIAGFQDLVIDFCDSHPADVASFLDWWDTTGKNKSISTPEGTDAVQIITIHKSKGLEFKCVIVPYAHKALTPSGMNPPEWRWIKPHEMFAAYDLPPFIPVNTDSNLSNSLHADVYNDYSDMFMMDAANNYYVAFTRAVDELYIFTKVPAKSGSNFGKDLHKICEKPDDTLETILTPENGMFLPDASLFNAYANDDELKPLTITCGEKPTVKRDGKDRGIEARVIDNYRVSSIPEFLHYKEDDDQGTTTVLPDAEDNDPRSEGNLMHAIMAGIKVPSDLKRSVTALKTKGMISNSQAREWQGLLAKAIANPTVAEWFSPAWEVANERSLLFPNKMLRPDRILFAKDRKSAVIIDYKFGAVPDSKKHVTQVAHYISALEDATGIHRIDGFVWYVRENKIIKI